MAASFGSAGGYYGTYDGTNVPTITFKEVGGSSATARKLQIVKATWKTNPVNVQMYDGNGKPTGHIHVRNRRELDLQLRVRADNIANSKVAMRAPTDNSTIVLTDLVADDDAFLNGTYCYQGGASVAFSDEGECEISIPCYQELDSAGNVISSATLMTLIV